MKKILMTIWIVFLAIVFFPITLGVGMLYLIWFLKEYPKYKKSYSKRIKKIKYSHHYYKSYTYQLFETLKNKESAIDLVKYDFCDYFEGKNIYFFAEVPLYFSIKDNNLMISIDGDPLIDYKEAIDLLSPTTSKEKYLLVIKEKVTDIYLESVEIDSFQSILFGLSIDEIAKKIIKKE